MAGLLACLFFLCLPIYLKADSDKRIQKTFSGLQLRVQLPTSSFCFLYIRQAQDSHFKDIPEKEYSTIQKQMYNINLISEIIIFGHYRQLHLKSSIMKTYVAFLRGINVSGKNLIKMPELALLFEMLGYSQIQTYIQSGNVIFRVSDVDEKKLESEIQDGILKKFGFHVPVLIKNTHKLKAIYENNPFLSRNEIDVDKLHVSFLFDFASDENVKKLNEIKFDDAYYIFDDVMYLFCPNGYGKTKLNNTFIESKLKVTATTRNWKTIGKLVEIAGINPF